MDKKINEKVIKDTLLGLSSVFEKEFENNKEYDILREYFKDDIVDYEEYNIMKIFPIDQVINSKLLKYGNKKHILSDIVINFRFFDCNVTELIIKKTGTSACSADKSRWIINAWIKNIIEDKEIDMTIDDKCFWKPNFGSSEQWLSLMNSLHSLLHGKPIQYLISLKDLMSNTEII